METFDLVKFYNNEKLSSMMIDQNISMEYIYTNLKNEKHLLEEQGIKIIKKKNELFNIQYKDIEFNNFFETPIKIEIKNKKIDIISCDHLTNLIDKYNIMHTKIECNKCKKVLDGVYNIIEHKNHQISIEDKDFFIRIKEEHFQDFFPKEQELGVKYLGKEFKNPEEFEKNFKYYFKNYDEIYKDKPFKLYKTKTREKIVDAWSVNMQLSVRNFFAYFGQSGMGKSITMILVLKYNINHKNYGTLYLNVKSILNLFEKKEYNSIKQILIDEIPYLFYNRYDEYFKCANTIALFSFESFDSFWDLIVKILEIINDIPKDNKIYFFIFDQYNDKTDKNSRLIKIYQEFSVNKSKKKLGIITLSSMNNKDIKDYKINFIRSQLDKKFINEIIPLKDLKELNEIFDLEKLSFDDYYYDEFFDSFGRNIKYYNIIYDYYYNQKQKEFEKYMDEEKKKIKNKIKEFYDCESNMKNIIKLLYFSTTTEYDLDRFLKIVEFVPFKYFDPKIECKDENTKYIIIKYAFPLVEEIRNELLGEIIYFELNIYDTLCQKDLLDGGARGELFEKFVTFHLNPKSGLDNRKIFFKDIDIDDTITMKSFIPKTNEKIIKRKKKKKLAEGTYLFTQKIINGKDLDILIVKIKKDKKAIVYAMQLTIHKPDDKMFTKIYLINCLKLLKKNLENIYDFEIIYNTFAYIFDKTYKDETLLKNMINKCNYEGISFMLFDPINLEFYDRSGAKTEYLDTNTSSPDINTHQKRFHMINDDSDLFDDFLKNIPKTKVSIEEAFYKIQPFEKQKALEDLRKNFENGNTIKDLKYERIAYDLAREDFCKTEIYFGKSKDCHFMIYYSKKRNKFIHYFLNDVDGVIFEENKPYRNYAVYSIIRN